MRRKLEIYRHDSVLLKCHRGRLGRDKAVGAGLESLVKALFFLSLFFFFCQFIFLLSPLFLCLFKSRAFLLCIANYFSISLRNSYVFLLLFSVYSYLICHYHHCLLVSRFSFLALPFFALRTELIFIELPVNDFWCAGRSWKFLRQRDV